MRELTRLLAGLSWSVALTIANTEPIERVSTTLIEDDGRDSTGANSFTFYNKQNTSWTQW